LTVVRGLYSPEGVSISFNGAFSSADAESDFQLPARIPASASPLVHYHHRETARTAAPMFPALLRLTKLPGGI
jgi:hypothetical protein